MAPGGPLIAVFTELTYQSVLNSVFLRKSQICEVSLRPGW